jgi:hypothetical protein
MARKNKTAPAEPVAETPAGDLAHDPSTNAPKLESWEMVLDDLELEARNWCDGDPIGSQDQADELTRLIATIEDQKKLAGADRDAETKPLYQVWKDAVARWKPAEERFEKLVKVCKRVLTPWLQAVEAENRRKAEEARKAAEDAANLAREQAAASRQTGGGFADEEIIEDLVADADRLQREAKEAARARPVARGGGRTTTLRKRWFVNVTDAKELLQHYLRHRPDVRDELKKWLHAQAEKDVRSQNGPKTLPGCSIWSEDVAV